MKLVKLYLLLVCMACTISSCKKETSSNSCEDLKKALIAHSGDEVKSIINGYISQLSSQVYNEQNMNMLAAAVTGNCSVTVAVSCFDCVFTLPSITELGITVNSIQPVISMVADVSYTADNKMKCVHVH